MSGSDGLLNPFHLFRREGHGHAVYIADSDRNDRSANRSLGTW
jgi:hypothetical protein